MQKLIDNSDYRKFIDLAKLSGELSTRSPNKELLYIRAQILCFQDEIRSGLLLLLEKDFKPEAEILARKNGPRAMTTLGKLTSVLTSSLTFRNFKTYTRDAYKDTDFKNFWRLEDANFLQLM